MCGVCGCAGACRAVPRAPRVGELACVGRGPLWNSGLLPRTMCFGRRFGRGFPSMLIPIRIVGCGNERLARAGGSGWVGLNPVMGIAEAPLLSRLPGLRSTRGRGRRLGRGTLGRIFLRPRSSRTGVRSRRGVFCLLLLPGTSCGVRGTANPGPGPIWRACGPLPCGTVGSIGSAGRRYGPRSLMRPTGVLCWLGPRRDRGGIGG